MTGFEDVNWSEMTKNMLMALPCLIMSLILWYKIFKARDATPVYKKRADIPGFFRNLKKKNLKEHTDTVKMGVKTWFLGLKYWKWLVFFISIIIYIVGGVLILKNKDIHIISVIILFTMALFFFGIYSTEDVENTFLMCAVGLLSSRHGHFLTGYNVIYPLCSFIIAVLLFIPAEIRACAVDKRNKVFKTGNKTGHERIVYYLSSGFLITSILYFLTSF